MRYTLKQNGELLDMGFNSIREADDFVENYLVENGLDWRAGFMFKSRRDTTPFEIVVTRTGELLKKER